MKQENGSLDRREFLKKVGFGAGLAIFGVGGLTGCTSFLKDPRLQRPGNLSGAEALQIPSNIEGLLAIIRKSPAFKKIERHLRGQTPVAFWSKMQLEQLVLTPVIFDIDVKPRTEDEFLVLPYVAFFVDEKGEKVFDAAIVQVDTNTLEDVNIRFYKHRQHDGRTKLHTNVAKKLKDAKEEFKRRNKPKAARFSPQSKPTPLCYYLTQYDWESIEPCSGGGGGGGCWCTKYCGGETDPWCERACNIGCIIACGGNYACAFACFAFCIVACYIPRYCCETSCR